MDAVEVDHEPYVRAWRHRLERERREARERARAAIEVGRTVARQLVEHLGVQRVAVFGSAARGELSPSSDLDLAVWSLPADRYLDALVIAHDGHDIPIDLVPYERALPHIRLAIDREAMDLAPQGGE